MHETITTRNLPDEFSASYQAKGVDNVVKNRFVPIDENKTRYVAEQEFRFKGYMRFIALFMPKSTFKKTSQKHMNDFKEFAEKA